MNEQPLPGYKTTEFWLTGVVNIAGAVIALLAARGLVEQEEGQLWLALVQAVAVAVIPIALAIINKAYIDSRREIKTTYYVESMRKDCIEVNDLLGAAGVSIGSGSEARTRIK